MTGKLMGIGSLVALASVAGVAEAKPAIRTDADRVKAPLVVDLPQLGTLKARTAAEIGEAGWMIGCECLDRDFADFKAYRDFLPPLGIKMIRLQSGWAECSPAASTRFRRRTCWRPIRERSTSTCCATTRRRS